MRQQHGNKKQMTLQAHSYYLKESLVSFENILGIPTSTQKD